MMQKLKEFVWYVFNIAYGLLSVFFIVFDLELLIETKHIAYLIFIPLFLLSLKCVSVNIKNSEKYIDKKLLDGGKE